MAINNPHQLIALEDSLSKKELGYKKKEALTIAHKSIGLSNMKNKQYIKAKIHFEKALFYSEVDSIARYSLYMIEGHLLRNTGKKEKLWDAIQMYYKAARLKPISGEPYFFIGKSYQSLGNKDFDLILESYQKALNLKLSKEIKEKVEREYSLAADREKRLKDFWK